ncbi:MAG: Crp/Fnr family transcriptional regulator [Acidobacteria bacterium]|nr:Crp/Fnr family transcriptional regulator [Acidobacteriota bacterium]
MVEKNLNPPNSNVGVKRREAGQAVSGRAAVGTAPLTLAAATAQLIPFSATRMLGVSPNDFTKAACLMDMPVFSDLRKEEIRRLDAAVAMKPVRKGQVIYRPDETGEILFLLKKGSVHLYLLSTEGRKFIVQTLEPMTFFGEMALLGQNMRQLFAEAAEDCLLCVMRSADVKRLIRVKPEIGLRMLEEVGKRLYDARERMGDIVFKKIPERVAKVLLKLSDEGARAIKGTTQQEIADMLGVYRETVSNTLAELRGEGVIGVGRRQISILNLEQLRRVAGEAEARRKKPYRAFTASR